MNGLEIERSSLTQFLTCRAQGVFPSSAVNSFVLLFETKRCLFFASLSFQQQAGLKMYWFVCFTIQKSSICRRHRGDRCSYCLIFQPLSLTHRDLCLLARETRSCFVLLFSSVSSGCIVPTSIAGLAHVLASQSMLVV